MNKVTDLKGRNHKWNLSKYKPVNIESRDRQSRSKYHLLARQLLYELYNSYSILEEPLIPGSDRLYLDFYIPNLELAVEVHGEQHYEFIPFFHKTKANFARAKVRDDKKKNWCELNDITLIVLPYSETEDEWRRRLQRC